MDRIQAAGFTSFDRPLLSQMAIATVLVGSAAALSSAGTAIPVNNIGFGSGWGDGAPSAALPLAAAKTVQFVPSRSAIATPRVSLAIADRPAPEVKTGPARAEPRLVLSRPARIVPTPGPVELQQPEPIAVPEAAIAVPPVPVFAAPVSAAPIAPAAPAELAVAAPAPVPATVAPAAAGKVDPAEPPLRLVNPPELRGFDLGRIPSSSRPLSSDLIKPANRPGAASKAESLGKKDRLVGDVLFHQATVSVAGSDGKAIDVRIGADMKPSLKVGDLLALVSDRMDPDSAARFAAAASAGEYVSLATLRAAGFDVNYNAGADSISIGVSQ